MSLIHQLGEHNTNLTAILDKYEQYLEQVEDNIKIKGKRLEAANLEQASWQAYYDERRIELYSLVKHFEAEVERVRGKLWVKYTENHTRELGPRDKDQYINNESAYLNMNALLIEVTEMYKKYDAVVDAFKSRAYALNNITKIRIAEMSEMVL